MTSIMEFLVNNPMTVALSLVAAFILVLLQIAPSFGVETAVTRRLKPFTKNPAIQKATKRANQAERRRQLVSEGFKKLEDESRSKRPSEIPVLLEQSGLSWTVRQFNIVSILFGLATSLLILFLARNIFVAAIAGALAGFYGPRMYAKRLRTKRFAAFIDELPNALDIIVRGTLAGSHVNACIRTIAHEAKEPVRSEFAIVADAQAVGRPISEALANLATRVPCAETNFLSIAVALQTESGGALAEAIRNLCTTLRERKAMRGEVAALSTEAKVSAMIICPLPVFFLVVIYFISPDYITPLFSTISGMMIGAAAAAWMGMGTFIMLKMSKIEV